MVLTQVKATNPYVAEDQDELTFENGETISVIAFDNPDEQVSCSSSIAVVVG